MHQAQSASGRLKRELGVFGASMMGLGSILGTGIFVSIGIAAGIAGPSVIIAITVAAVVATFNALSSAQLAAAHPVSGGAYEYGYRFLRPFAGFTAGWLFLLAKSASAATAALGFSGYILNFLGDPGIPRVPVAFASVCLLTAVVAAGIRRSSHLNVAIVSITLIALLAFAVSGFYVQVTTHGATSHFVPFFRGGGFGGGARSLLFATALMFVAYTGYGRIATLAEEVTDPARTIPRAIVATLVVSALLYVAVALAGIGSVGADFLYESTTGEAAPLEIAARRFALPLLPGLLAVGAATAMLGVLLNLLLGLSRVLLAMGRRRDMPEAVAKLNKGGHTPALAVLAVGALTAALTLIGDVSLTWSFSAFTVLIYYAITNACALALPEERRLFPQWVAFAGLVSCLFLAFWVEWQIWLAGLALIAVGLAWHWARRHRAGNTAGTRG